MAYKINTYIKNEDNSARFVLGFDNTGSLLSVFSLGMLSRFIDEQQAFKSMKQRKMRRRIG